MNHRSVRSILNISRPNKLIYRRYSDEQKPFQFKKILGNLKDYGQVLAQQKTNIFQIFLWLIVGSVAMEMKWQKNEIKELELLRDTKVEQLRKQIQDLKRDYKEPEISKDFGLY
ncbi:hypothetical protein HK103_004549 [Boothiomyces macroporosus]|uniref:Uncharacterized protein n=1 Tax=Boothiomyces macroporosus TaxID=261099 RepID=A0AAD5Y3D4_9FUNG|nr:hypothetical protein HK103_004549 [Boothiomyces macroporosus]